MNRVRTIGWAAAVLIAAGGAAAPASAQLQQAIGVAQQTAAEASQSQTRIDQLDDQISAIERDFRATLRQLERLQRYNQSLSAQIRSQQLEIEELTAQIESVSGLQRDVVPLMEDMLAALGNFVRADAPFLEQERADRITRLRDLLNQASASPAEKYRSIVEAYEIESEYGRTIEPYEGFLPDAAGQDRRVEFLRIGRVALMYSTLDGSEVGAWHPARQEWVELPGSYRDIVNRGLDMAKELIPPDLLTIPVTAPVTAQ